MTLSTRRALLLGAPVVAVSIAMPAVAMVDPVPALVARWREVSDAWATALRHADDENEPAIRRLEDERLRLEEAIRTTVATTPDGLRAQFEFLAAEMTEEGTFCAFPEVWGAQLLAALRAGLRAL